MRLLLSTLRAAPALPLAVLLHFSVSTGAEPVFASDPAPPDEGDPKRSDPSSSHPSAVKLDEALGAAASRDVTRSLLPASELVLRGERLLDEPDRGSVNAAAAIFKAALEVDPGNGPALAGSARVAAVRYSRRWEEDDALVDRALDLARQATLSSPDDARAHAALAAVSLVAEDGATAYDEADRAWSLRTAQTPAWVREAYAHSLIVRGDHKGALVVLEELRAAEPARYQTWYLQGIAHLEMANLAEALLAFRRSNILSPDYPPALLQMARVYDRMERRDYAAQIYAQVKSRFPEETGRVFVRMAASLISRGKYLEALDGIDQARFKTKRGLGEGTVVYLKALCFDRLGRTEEAAALYRKVTQDYPDASYGSLAAESLASTSYEALARINLEGGRQEEAVRLMGEAMSKQRPTLSLFTGLADVYSDYRLHAEAIEVLKRASAIDFGPRRAGLKASLYVAWAREAKALGDAAPGPPADLLDALDRDAASIGARGDIADFLEAARACVLAGDTARALSWMKLATDHGYRQLDWVSGDADLAPLARERGFEELRRSLPRP